MYADYSFYVCDYYGNTLSEENADMWLTRASDELDTLTFGRLINGFPENEVHAEKVKKAVCAIADALYFIDVQCRATSAQTSDDGYKWVVASMSSGRESVSYNTNNTATNKYAAAAANESTATALINCIIERYVANIPDKYGVNLLYSGVD